MVVISVTDFNKWLSKDVSISTELQKIIIHKLVEYVLLSSIDGKVVESEVVDLIS